MTTSPLLPFYHPSTVLLIDDNQRFLENFSLQLDQDLAVLFDHSARRGLQLLENNSGRPSLDQRCFSWQQGQKPNGDFLFRLDIALIEKEISNADRFGEVSVVIVDYDMPEMSGLDFCKQISGQRIKKILLTGVGDEKIAVQAFNEGIIDRFLLKSDPEIENRNNQTIYELQQQYVNEVSRLVQGGLALKSPEFLIDPEFSDHFFMLMKEHNIVEYYYVEDPEGFLLVSDEGDLKRLLVYSEESLQRALFNIRQLQPPPDIIKSISSGRLLPWIWAAPDEFDEEDPFDWHDFLHPSKKIEGRRTWHVSLAANPPADIEFDSRTASYSAYLDRLDQQSGR